MQRTDEELARIRALDEAQAAQERRHELDPEHEPLFLPADFPGQESEAYTAGWEQEEGA